jgi:3D (Asp-Asp-Asp) domain-containing protein
MKFLNLACKFGLKTALSDLKLRIKQWAKRQRITTLNKRKWREWQRNTDIIPLAVLCAFGIMVATVILIATQIVLITTYQHSFHQCPTIKRIIVPEVSAKEIPKNIITATITGYNALPNQTQGDPNIMASGKNVYVGAIACPRKYPFGTKVEIDNVIYTCEDRLNIKYDNRFDIFFEHYEDAINWGKQTKQVIIY